MNTPNSVDITPTPRILRTLGDIPFAPWQCLAELMDNSLDAFSDAENRGISISTPQIDIYWSSEAVSPADREIVIEDNGVGMPLDVLQNAAKAGYSSNDPIHNLGLFGMGFNISTARLGDETIFLSATKDSSKWVGIKISFSDLIKQQTFSAPVITFDKKTPEESGTRICIRQLKDGIFAGLRKKETLIRRQLQKIYTPILGKGKVSIYVQGKQLVPMPHCVWGDSRFVTRKGEQIPAVIHIDRDLGDGLFDMQRNRYLSDDEIFTIDPEHLPSHVVRRARRLKGWVGIQRYADTTNFGIDFIRNGRKILVSDKSLFEYENPDTGTIIQEYPIELGSTYGGRIVGEIHVDYLIPTYQKNGFDTTDKAWRLTREALRGAGPVLPKNRASAGYDGENTSPIGKLINAYRRPDAGTKNLAIPNAQAKEFAKFFEARNPEYESDEKWYKVAQEVDRAAEDGKSYTPVNSGDAPSDDVESYLPSSADTSPKEKPVAGAGSHETDHRPAVAPHTSTRDDLISSSGKVETISGKYIYSSNSPGMEVIAWKTTDKIKSNGERVPYIVFQDGIDIDFFYDPTHPIIAEYPITAKQLLLLALAEKFTVRDSASLQTVYLGLLDNNLADERINYQALQERAAAILQGIRDKLPSILGHRFTKAKEIIQQVEPEEEQLLVDLLQEAQDLLEHYQSGDENAHKALEYVPDATIRRLISAMPEEFLDGHIFDQPYASIKGISEQMLSRVRQNSVEKVVAYISDVIAMRQGTRNPSKNELIRFSNTLTLLEGLMVS